MKIEKTNDDEELIYRMNQLRGFFAFVVLFSHIWGYTGIVLLVPFNKMVTIAVSFFFFLSGCGMMRSYQTKKNYIKKIYFVKIPFLLWMAFLAYVLSAAAEIFLFDGKEMFLPLGIRKFLYTTNWYVYELIAFYIVFSLIIRFVNREWHIAVMGGISAVAFIILYNSGLVEAYYNSIIGFWFGMLCGRRGFVSLIQKYKIKGWIFGDILLVTSFAGMFILDHNSALFAIVRNLAAVGAIIVVIYLMQYINMNNLLIRYFSKVSPEIYFYHMPIAILASDMWEGYLYAIIVTLISLIMAVLINPINNKVQRLIEKRVNG